MVPGRLERLRYFFGGVLPQHREWVRHDLTDAGWRWRVVRRVMVQALPFAIALALLPGTPSMRLSLVLFLLLTSGFTAAAAGEALRDRRLRQHGWPPAVGDDAVPPSPGPSAAPPPT